jgi:YHS domain-containing protein
MRSSVGLLRDRLPVRGRSSFMAEQDSRASHIAQCAKEFEMSDQSGTALDPVCGMHVDVATAQHTAEHNGKTYYFCSRGCMLDFADDPERYLDPAYEPKGMEGH